MMRTSESGHEAPRHVMTSNEGRFDRNRAPFRVAIERQR
jgi:hypothetical protein